MDAALTDMVQHPAVRAGVLGDTYDRVVLAAVEEPGSGELAFAAIMVEPSADAGSAREQFVAKVTPRWPGEDGPEPAPNLQSALDELAERLASGKLPMKKFNKAMDKIFGEPGLVQGRAISHAQVVPPGEPVDTSEVVMEDWARHLAVGQASGDLGTDSGITYAVIVYVMASKAR
ncbi:MAG: hypothetical protein KTR31_35125 [Myxococcales bacterium]|nr:hypothetical protein [Myxococcales bacterium]